MQRVLDRFVYWMFRLTILVMRPVPLRPAYWIAGQVALLCYWLIFPRHRRALNANLSRVLQSDDKRYVDAVARASFRNFGKYVIDVIHYPSLSREEIKRRLRFTDWRILNDALASGRGVVISTLHYGNWDLGAAALAATDYPISAIAERFRYEPMNRLVQGSRTKLGMRVLAGDRIGPQVLRVLRRGEFIALLIDVADARSETHVDFFGAPARVSSAPARIALRTGSWVIPAVVLRGPKDDLIIRPVVDASLRDFTPSGDEEADVQELTRRIMRCLEPHIRAHPDQWFIFQPLWGSSRALPKGVAAANEAV